MSSFRTICTMFMLFWNNVSQLWMELLIMLVCAAVSAVVFGTFEILFYENHENRVCIKRLYGRTTRLENITEMQMSALNKKVSLLKKNNNYVSRQLKQIKNATNNTKSKILNKDEQIAQAVELLQTALGINKELIMEHVESTHSKLEETNESLQTETQFVETK